MKASESLSIRKSILIYIIVWLLVSIGYTLLSEPLVKWLFPGYDNVELFLFVWTGGLAVISGVTLLALVVRIARILLARRRSGKRLEQVA